MNTKLTILTSRQNFSWISMEEIISWIENTWSSWANSRSIDYQIIDVDKGNFSDFIKNAFTSEKIIITCFNTNIAKFLVPLRKTFSINTPWVFYLHGLASFGCWPLFHWKLGQQLTSSDIFIGSCERDKEQFNLIFRNISCRIIPFSLKFTPTSTKTPASTKKFAFIGRISSQKNLHTLILALSLIKDQNWELHFFGKADNYGSPHMGHRDCGYDLYLMELAQKLDLTSKVLFHGFKGREEIEQEMSHHQWFFIAPSIHSDENFGMAAFRCLLNGHQAILSDWGGHADFKIHFKDSVTLIPVYKSEIGPFINANELAITISEINYKDITNEIPKYYSESFLIQNYDKIWESHKKHNSSQVSTTTLLNEILKRRDDFKDIDNKGIQIFSDYQDPLKDQFFNAYGQNDLSVSIAVDNISLCPWVEENEQFFQVNDPHRGRFSLPKSNFSRKDMLNLGLAY